MSFLARFVGHNGFRPCRICNITGIAAPGGRTLYVPLDRSRHPAVQADDSKIKKYDPFNLPLRTDAEIKSQAEEVDMAPNATQSKRLATQYGIKGSSVFHNLSSLIFPHCIPYEVMHLWFENILQILVNLWTGSFKDLDEGTGCYELPKNIWEAIGAATAACGDFIPSAFGQRPVDIASDAGKKASTADSWSFWLMHLGPVLLHNHFKKRVYYEHFVKFAKIVIFCMDFEYERAQLPALRASIASWVEEFEKLYYQYNPDRMSACPLTIHGFLHIPDQIEWIGPTWTHWSYPTERYCNRIGPAIKSRRYPWACIDGYVTDYAVLSVLIMNYDLKETLRMRGELGGRTQLTDDKYKTCCLVAPQQPSTSISNTLHEKIMIHFVTRFGKTATGDDVTLALIRQYYKPDRVSQWAKVRRLGGGDDMKASAMDLHTEDHRNATYIRYDALVDINSRNRRQAPVYELQTFYSQLQNIFAVTFPAVPELNHPKDEMYFLAGIQVCEGMTKKNGLGMPYYKKLGRYEVVDMTCVQCLIGRVKAPDGDWAIIDRSGTIQRAVYVPE
ncbi:hypothetical protein D9758_017948 [Tetrapyrgos nigripes]|uniref:Uncharacterized protein n=1 Tax=Tetrapyrgos nigripes TaxID=182062 RepID=A0A8H5F9W2_9AGAR|nr:hypothetical protein D9758_017948 [Tetrapyrgos nigripes]